MELPAAFQLRVQTLQMFQQWVFLTLSPNTPLLFQAYFILRIFLADSQLVDK